MVGWGWCGFGGCGGGLLGGDVHRDGRDRLSTNRLDWYRRMLIKIHKTLRKVHWFIDWIIIFKDGCTLISTFWFWFVLTLYLHWIGLRKLPVTVVFRWHLESHILYGWTLLLLLKFSRVLPSTEQLFLVIYIEKFNFVQVSSILWCNRIPEFRTAYSCFKKISRRFDTWAGEEPFKLCH